MLSLSIEARESLPYPSAFVSEDHEFNDGSDAGVAVEDANVLAAFSGSDLVGIAAAKYLRLTKFDHKATLMYAFVSSRFRGGGVGSELVDVWYV